MDHEFPFGIFRPEKQDYLFRCSVARGNFPLERLETEPCSIYFPAGFSRKFFVNGKQPVIPVRNKKTPKDSVASQLFKTSFTDLIQQQQHFISPHNIQEIKIYNNSTDDDRGAGCPK